MEVLHAISPPFVLLGFLVGLLVGLTGVGGGSLMTPMLVLIFGVQATTAVGTDLLYAAVTKSGGTIVHHRRASIDWRVTRRLATGSIPAAILTLLVLWELGVRVLSALAPGGGYQSSWGTLLLVLGGDEAGCGARHVDPRPSGIGLSARRKAIAGSAAVTAAGSSTSAAPAS